jgi:hypothetical protein
MWNRLLDVHAAGQASRLRLTLAKSDPDGDFSSDYEDLFFTRVRRTATAQPKRWRS